MLNSMSHTLTASWLFYNLLVWAVFCKINLWKHSFEFEDYKKAYYALFTCYNKLTTSQNIFVCSGFFYGYTIFSSQTRPSDQIPLGTASTVKTHSLFDLQFVALKVPVRWVKPTLITGMSIRTHVQLKEGALPWDVDYSSDNISFYTFTCFTST